MAESKRQRSNVVVEELQEDDLQAAGAIFHDAFDGDEINAILYPEHRIARAGYTRKDRVAHSARSVRKNHWNKQGKIVLKAVDPDSREILGIAVWVEPGYVQKYQREQREKAAAAAGQENGKDAVREEEEEEGKNLELDEAVLGRMMNEMTSVRERVMGDEPFWYLSFLVITPKAQGRGVGSVLLQWGMDKADLEQPPLPTVLESSKAGRPLYEKRGFKVEGWLQLSPSTPDGKGVDETRVHKFPFMVRPARQQ